MNYNGANLLMVPKDPAHFALENVDMTDIISVMITTASGASIFSGNIISGVSTIASDIPALAVGDYPFTCIVHPGMTGTLTVR